MWWSDRLLRALALIAFLGAAAALSGCTLTPVYGGAAATASRMALVYPAPSSRLEQIVYHELQLSFPSAEPDSGAPTLAITASARGTALALSHTPDIASARRIRVTATATLSRPGQRDIRFTRFAEADFNTINQVSADYEAEIDAQERAARAAAESIRLALLGLLSPA